MGAREELEALMEELGCGDNSCIYRRPRGMATNGGCCSLMDSPARARRELQRVVAAVRRLLAESQSGEASGDPVATPGRGASPAEASQADRCRTTVLYGHAEVQARSFLAEARVLALETDRLHARIADRDALLDEAAALMEAFDPEVYDSKLDTMVPDTHLERRRDALLAAIAKLRGGGR